MGYDEIRGIGGAIGLVMLFFGFIGVIAYALWPGNKQRFDHAAMAPLDDDDVPATNSANGGQSK
ncbi:cbb3-type cytochrome oxidase subunit 3 [Pyruvatibacter sp.]